jgi:hypothetical protein
MLTRWAWKATVIPALLFSSSAIAQMKGAWVDPPADLSATHNVTSEPSPQSDVIPPQLQAAPASSPNTAVTREDELGSSVETAKLKSSDRSRDLSATNIAHQDRSSSPRPIPRFRAAQPAQEDAPAVPMSSSVVAQRSSASTGVSARELDARNFAENYLSLWSASNDRTLRATPAFYGSSAVFHGRSMSSKALLNEKRRFVQRWPDREYRYRPGTMGIKCEPNGRVCIVRSIFDFDAANSQLGRRSRGVGTHELTVTFAGDRPVIVSENSRVLSRGSSR